MKRIMANRGRARQRRLERRLDRRSFPRDLDRPVLSGGNVQFDLAGRDVGTSYGGVGLLHRLSQRLDLAGRSTGGWCCSRCTGRITRATTC